MTKGKGEIHNLYELQFAKRVVKDVPKILHILEEFQSKLYQYNEYRDIGDVLYSINDAKTMLEVHYEAYKLVVKRKGKVIYDKKK